MNIPQTFSCVVYLSWVRCGFSVYTHRDTARFMHALALKSVFLDVSSGYVTLLPGPFRSLDAADVTRMKFGCQNCETVKTRVHSSDVIGFSGIKDSSRALLHKLMRAFLRLLCSLERDYTGFSTDLPLFLCKTTKLPLWQDQGLGGGACPIVGGLWQVCKIGNKCDELWSSA